MAGRNRSWRITSWSSWATTIIRMVVRNELRQLKSELVTKAQLKQLQDESPTRGQIDWMIAMLEAMKGNAPDTTRKQCGMR